MAHPPGSNRELLYTLAVVNPNNISAVKLNKYGGFTEYQDISYRKLVYLLYYEIK
ncbi:MAG: hypothetical protein H5U07_06435 [Candidatus Aminicenantes bacterium]|nr:hypothetical protein [Candidatus Aminicenantes bacterium]